MLNRISRRVLAVPAVVIKSPSKAAVRRRPWPSLGREEPLVVAEAGVLEMSVCTHRTYRPPRGKP